MSRGVTPQHVPMETSINPHWGPGRWRQTEGFYELFLAFLQKKKINPQMFSSEKIKLHSLTSTCIRTFTYVRAVSMFFQAAPISEEHVPKTWLNVLYVGLSSEI